MSLPPQAASHTKLRKSLLLIPVPRGRGLSFQWKDAHSCHIRGKSMVFSQSVAKVVQ